MLMLKIAWRNIFRQRRRSLLTILAMFGGFTLSAISFGWADGTYNRIIEAFTRNQLGHIQIHAPGYLDRPSLYDRINDFEVIGETAAKVPGVEAWAPRFYAAGLASLGDRTAGLSIVGIDPLRENVATRFERKIVEGKPLSVEASRQTVLGRGLSRRLKATLGSEIVIVSQAADGSIANDLYTVVGILESQGNGTDLATLYLHIKDAQALFVLEDAAHEIAIVCSHLKGVDEVTAGIRRALEGRGLEVAPWQEFARAFYVAMQADKRGNWVVLFIIVLIVAIGVLNTVLMTVLERTREYGALRAIGTRPGLTFGLIVLEVSFMAAISVAVGAVCAVGINYWLSLHGVAMPEPITYGGMEFARFYGEVNARSLYVPALTVLSSALLVSIWPALRAARIQPAKALRTH